MSQDKEPSSLTSGTTAPRAPVFKKVNKKKKKARLRSRDDDDNNDDEHDSTSLAIQQTKKKRKLLNQVLYKKGLDAAATLTASTTTTETTTPQQDESTISTPSNVNLTQQRLEGTFAGEGGDATAEGGVLQRKHQSAMEQFIQQNIQSSKSTAGNDNVASTQTNKEDTPKTATDKLYAELASASQAFTGTSSNNDNNTIIQTTKEGDVGAGGAMLGGTGIAEVTLPADDRIQTIRATELAVSSLSSGDNKTSSAVPQDGNGKQEQTMSNVPSSYSHNFQLHTQEWIQAQQQQEQQQPDAAAAVPVIQQEEEKGGRMGFQAARHAAARGQDGDGNAKVSGQKKKRASGDDRAFKTFVTRQNESRY